MCVCVYLTSVFEAYPITSAKIIARIGDEISLTCIAYGYPLPTYIWFHNGSRRVRDSRVHLKNGTLTISNTQENDRGSYECQAMNEGGMIHSQPTVLMVYGECGVLV